MKQIQTYGSKPTHLRLGNVVKSFLAGWFSPTKYKILKEHVELNSFNEEEEEQ